MVLGLPLGFIDRGIGGPQSTVSFGPAGGNGCGCHIFNKAWHLPVAAPMQKALAYSLRARKAGNGLTPQRLFRSIQMLFSVSLKKFFQLLLAGLFAAGLAACAKPTPPEGDLTPPPRKPFDAKTQLESGRVR